MNTKCENICLVLALEFCICDGECDNYLIFLTKLN